MKNRYVTPIGLFLLAILAYFCARWYFVRLMLPLEIARAQVVAFPLCILALWFLADKTAGISRWLFVLVTLIGFASVGYTYNTRHRSEKTILLAPLKNDSFATQTRITHSELEAASRRIGGPPVVVSYDSITTREAAEKLLEHDRNIAGVLWGNTHWLTLTLAKKVSVKEIASIPSPWMKDPSKLQLITQIPSIGLSYDPIGDTSLFLASLFAQTEITLRAAAEQQSIWTTKIHRAFANLLLGNMLFERALSASSYQYALLDCAIEAYLQGWMHIEMKDDPDLKNALLNNLAVATYVQGQVEHNSEAKYRAQEWFRKATRIPKSLHSKGSIYYASLVAMKNYSDIRARLINKNREVLHDR